jgi:hypothetical protein
MSSYYEEEDDLDIRIHRGRASPQPVIYSEHRRPARPTYYQHGTSYLEPQYSSAGVHRSRSTGRRHSPPAQPVIINKIYNEERYEDDDRSEYLQLAPRPRARSRSRSRAPSFTSSSRHSSRDEYELEKTRHELERFKLKAERDEEAKRLKKELELEELRKEREEAEEKKRSKKEAEEAVEKWKRDEAKRKEREKKEEEEAIERFKRKQEKEKKEKEEREKEYQHRLEDDLRKAGYDDRAIAVVTKKEKAIDPDRPTFTRMSRRHLSIETLNAYRIDYEFDVVSLGDTYLWTKANQLQDPNYFLIRRWVPEYEQDFLWNHTREIRERRQPVLVAIEGKKKHGDVEFEFVRKKEHKRKVSPSPLLTFLAGGKR